MSAYRPKKGDRVRVVLEGEVDQVNSDGSARVSTGKYFTFAWVDPGAATIEKIEPPVEVFRPGDVVRHKTAGRFTFALGKFGYLDIVNGVWNDRPNEFTSESYEKVDLD